MKNQSIHFKVGVLFTAFLGIILVFFSIYPLYKVQDILQQEQEDTLLIKARQIRNYIGVYEALFKEGRLPIPLFNQALNDQTNNEKGDIIRLLAKDIQTLRLSKDIYRIRDAKGREILRSSNFTDEAEKYFNSKFVQPDARFFYYTQINGVLYHGLNFPIKLPDSQVLYLQLAIPITYAQQILNSMVISFVDGILIILLVGILVIRYLILQILRPVKEITAAAQSITQRNLDLRIPIHEYDKEMEELVKAFNQMIERLGASFTYVNDFNSMVSHEMKTPLAIIRGELEMALDGDGSKEEHKKTLKGVLEEVHKLIKMIKDMLLLAEYEYKPEIFKMEKMDLIALLKETFQHCHVLAQEKNIRFELSTGRAPAWIEGDIIHIRRVFFNLIHNAVKFTPPRGEIKISTEISDAHVFVHVRDSGTGIPPINQGRIFEKFYRSPSIKQKRIEGSGLGLSIARAIVQAHHGNISFKSQVNQGTVFTVRLPLMPSYSHVEWPSGLENK